MHVMFVYMYCIFIKQWKSGSRSCGIVPGHCWMPLHVMIAMVHLRVFVSVRWWKRPGQPTWPLPKEPLGSCSRVQWSKLMCPCVCEYSYKKLTKTYSYICIYIYIYCMYAHIHGVARYQCQFQAFWTFQFGPAFAPQDHKYMANRPNRKRCSS